MAVLLNSLLYKTFEAVWIQSMKKKCILCLQYPQIYKMQNYMYLKKNIVCIHPFSFFHPWCGTLLLTTLQDVKKTKFSLFLGMSSHLMPAACKNLCFSSLILHCKKLCFFVVLLFQFCCWYLFQFLKNVAPKIAFIFKVLEFPIWITGHASYVKHSFVLLPLQATTKNIHNVFLHYCMFFDMFTWIIIKSYIQMCYENNMFSLEKPQLRD